MSDVMCVTTLWSVHEYIPALGYYAPRTVLENVYKCVGAIEDYPIKCEVIEQSAGSEYDSTGRRIGERYEQVAFLDDARAISLALGTYVLIEAHEITNAYGTLEYVQVDNAWTDEPLGRLYCTSHASLDPLVAREDAQTISKEKA